jgi:DNA topoisomerase I
MTRLRNVDCSSPGITRRRSGRGFVYLDQHGERLVDPAQLARIRALVIPPAWQRVWICTAPNGHIQATGFDAKGRRQYLYHEVWRINRDRDKFDHMIGFASSLPRFRKVVGRHLESEALGRDQVLGCAAHLLDIGFFRIGSEGYAEENHTYGLATMLRSHVTVDGNSVTFDYPAKHSLRRVQSVVDPAACEILSALKRRRGGGPELLAYRERVNARSYRWCDVTSNQINEYLRLASGVSCSAKDFRTWNATVLAAVALAVGTPGASPTMRKRRVNRAMQEVAHYLGNTPAVARRSYVDPRVIDAYMAGETIALPRDGLDSCATEDGGICIQGSVEKSVLKLLKRTGSHQVAA